MGAVGFSLGLGALAVAAVNLTTNRPHDRHPDAVGASVAMVAIWGVTMWSHAWFSPPKAELINPILDVSLAVWVAYTFLTRPKVWKLALFTLLAAQSAMHVIYQAEYTQNGILFRYTLGLNLTYIAELVAVGWPGGLCVARRVGHHLRDHRHPRGLVGLG